VVVVLGVLLLTWLGLARMRDTVADELSGARMLAQLAQRLSTLQQLPDEQARQTLLQWQQEGSLRHLRVRVVDAAGVVVVDDLPAQSLTAPMRLLARAGVAMFEPGPSFTVAWPLARPGGGAWQATLTAVPESERVEALTSLLEGVVLLAAVGLLMLAVMAWNTRRAFAPMSRLLAAIARLETAPAPGGGGHALALPAMPIAELETVAGALRRLDAALAAAEQQRRRLLAQLISLQEDERQRLARELHDEFGQRLTALRVNATWLARQLHHQPEWRQVVQEMAAQCEDIQQDVRATLARLRPLAGDAGDEAPAPQTLAELGRLLQGLVADWQRSAGRETQFTLSLQARGSDGAGRAWPGAGEAPWLPRDTVLALYRVTQEALTNVARHSGAAAHAELQLQADLPATPDAALALQWAVQDDGVGLADADAAFGRGNGLVGLRERLWALGSDLQMAAMSPGAQRPGCRLSACLSLAQARPSPGHGA
jgi:two-component system sensor histidine kinase UhpB